MFCSAAPQCPILGQCHKVESSKRNQEKPFGMIFQCPILRQVIKQREFLSNLHFLSSNVSLLDKDEGSDPAGPAQFATMTIANPGPNFYTDPMKLKRRNWSERNYKALDEFLAGVRPGEIAVFDWDNTCICGDIGEALLRRLTFSLGFAMDAGALAATLPDTIHGVSRILVQGKPFSLKKMKKAVCSAYERLKQDPSSLGKNDLDDDYRIFTSGLLALNRALEETPGIGCGFAYPWVNLLLQGLPLDEFDRLAVSVVEEELANPLRRHVLSDPLGRWRYAWTGGIRLYPEMRDLAARFRERGGRVVVSTASNRQLVEKMASLTAFPCQSVIGMELKVAGGRFGRSLAPGLRPNLGLGKVANLRRRLEGEPALVAGDSGNDYEMLVSFPGTRLRLVIDRHAGGRIALLARRARSGEKGLLAQKINPRRGEFRAAPG
jgi:phosphoserine phosphatase